MTTLAVVLGIIVVLAIIGTGAWRSPNRHLVKPEHRGPKLLWRTVLTHSKARPNVAVYGRQIHVQCCSRGSWLSEAISTGNTTSFNALPTEEKALLQSDGFLPIGPWRRLDAKPGGAG